MYEYSFNDPINFIDPTGEVGIAGAAIGAAIEIGMQAIKNASEGCDVLDANNYDWVDVATSAAAGAILPGLFSSGKSALTASRAIGTLTGQLKTARTAGRIAKIQERIGTNAGRLGGAIATAGGVQAGKAVIKSATGSGCGCKK